MEFVAVDFTSALDASGSGLDMSGVASDEDPDTTAEPVPEKVGVLISRNSGFVKRLEILAWTYDK